MHNLAYMEAATGFLNASQLEALGRGVCIDVRKTCCGCDETTGLRVEMPLLLMLKGRRQRFAVLDQIASVLG